VNCTEIRKEEERESAPHAHVLSGLILFQIWSNKTSSLDVPKLPEELHPRQAFEEIGVAQNLESAGVSK
jgi:hypothetical protein